MGAGVTYAVYISSVLINGSIVSPDFRKKNRFRDKCINNFKMARETGPDFFVRDSQGSTFCVYVVELKY